MYIIIAGAGVVGFHIASLLVQENHQVAVIDQSDKAIENVNRQLDAATVLGNAVIPKTLREVEVHRADLIIGVTGSDETNMIICLVAKELGARMTMARVRNPEYSGYFISSASSPTTPRKVIRPKTFGVDLFINPVVEATREIVDILSSFYATPLETFANGLVQIREFRMEKGTIADKALSKLKFPKACVVAAILRAEGMFIPTPDENIKQGDRVYIIAASDNMNELGEMFASPQRPARSAVIIGGGRVGCLVAEGLHEQGVSVKIIEKNIDRCHEDAARLKGATIVQGDGTDRDLLIEQGVPMADAFIASTESDEVNILSGLLAKSLGIARNLVLVNNPGNIPLANTVGVDVAASPPLLTARKIARFALHGGAISVALLGGEQIQAIEFVTGPNAPIAGKKTKDAGLAKEAIFGAITRNSTVIIPSKENVIQPGDHVIVISPLTAIPSVEKLFA
jgi:trk system potassium uptake protein TrkA